MIIVLGIADLGQQPHLGCDSIKESTGNVPCRHIECLGNIAIVQVCLVGVSKVQLQPPLRRRCAISERRNRTPPVPAVRQSVEGPVDRTEGILLVQIERGGLQIGTRSELVARRSDQCVFIEVVRRAAEVVPEVPAIGQCIGVAAGFHFRPDARRRQQECAAYPSVECAGQVVVVAYAHAQERVDSEWPRLDEAPLCREGCAARQIRVGQRRSRIPRQKSASGRRNCPRCRNVGTRADADPAGRRRRLPECDGRPCGDRPEKDDSMWHQST